jgi:hypothetical protein
MLAMLVAVGANPREKGKQAKREGNAKSVAAQAGCNCNLTLSSADLRTTNAPGTYAFSPGITCVPGQMTKVVIQLLSADVAVTPSTCGGYTGPVFGYMRSFGSVQGMNAGITPQPYGAAVQWTSPGTNLVNVEFPFTMSFPPPQGGTCTDYLRFSLKISITNRDCKTCTFVKRYYFKRQPPVGALEPTPIPITGAQWPGGGGN